METLLAKFRNCLKDAGVSILEERNGILPEFVVDGVPGERFGNPNGNQREYLYRLSPFIVKSSDRYKFGKDETKPREELLKEVNAFLAFQNTLPLVEKVALLHIRQFDSANVQDVLLVEKEVEPYNERWDDKRKRSAKETILRIKQMPDLTEDGKAEFFEKNLGYDKDDKTYRFFDVFPR